MPQKVFLWSFLSCGLAWDKAGLARQGWACEKGDRIELSAFSPSFDNPRNILKFRAHALLLHSQDRFGKALHVGPVLCFRRHLRHLDADAHRSPARQSDSPPLSRGARFSHRPHRSSWRGRGGACRNRTSRLLVRQIPDQDPALLSEGDAVSPGWTLQRLCRLLLAQCDAYTHRDFPRCACSAADGQRILARPPFEPAPARCALRPGHL